MAGGPIKDDPAIERFNRMREEAYMNFRWTRRTTRTAVLGFILVPGAIYYAASKYYLKWDWVARLKNEPLTVANDVDSTK